MKSIFKLVACLTVLLSFNAKALVINGCTIEAGTSCVSADLSYADLSCADLSSALLTGADLYGADLSNADLSGVVLSDAFLNGADLSVTDEIMQPSIEML